MDNITLYVLVAINNIGCITMLTLMGLTLKKQPKTTFKRKIAVLITFCIAIYAIAVNSAALGYIHGGQ